MSRLLGPRDPDVAKPAFLFKFFLALGGTGMREQPLFHACHEDHRELKPLGIMQRHERYRIRVVALAVGRDLLLRDR